MERIEQRNHIPINKYLKNSATYIMFIVLFIVCAVLSDTFFSWLNIGNLLRQNSALVWVPMAMLMVIISGGIDLSAGSLIGLSSVTVATFLGTMGWGTAPSIIVTLLMCGAVGAVSGLLIAYLKLPAFITTLAMAQIANGIALYICHGAPVQMQGAAYSIKWIGTLRVPSASGGFGEVLSFLALILVVIAVVIWFVLKYTSFGRTLFSIGSNENAVRLAGINVRRLQFSVYALSGLFCGVAGIIGASRTNSGTYSAGAGWELDAIAACVIGGASLAGGTGSVPKVIIGVFVLALIGNIMNLLAIPAYPQNIIKGAIIIVAVLSQTKGIFSRKG